MENWRYVILPVLGMLIGWGTNWLALKMLFKPRKPFSVGRYKIQGLIPSRRNDLSGTIAKTISDELLSSEDLVKAMNELDIKGIALSQVSSIVEKKIESLDLKSSLPLSMLHDTVVSTAQSIVYNQVEASIDDFLQNMGDHVSGNLNIVRLMEEKLSSLDDDRIEEIVTEVSKKELKHIERLGAVLGFIIGCLQVLLLWLIE
uniref:DUF445 domain-containing protein n=1 Tax=uncultured marine group II/III euryarchaeote AD1000_39_G05 TaxID=1457764 RepID=A0A075FW72_9EURY|nr:hypothetical protein [uncultured marine group II/III euryarchaeote AD1000_39_G05]